MIEEIEIDELKNALENLFKKQSYPFQEQLEKLKIFEQALQNHL